MRQKSKIGEDMRQIFAKQAVKKTAEYTRNARHDLLRRMYASQIHFGRSYGSQHVE